MSNYDHVQLPAVEIGDRVRVEYYSRFVDRTIEQEGEVTDVFVNGFAFDSGRDHLSFRDRENDNGELYRAVGTLKTHDIVDGAWVHATDLNSTKQSIEDTPVEIIDG